MLSVLLLLAYPTAAPPSGYRIETKDAQRIRAELTWHVKAPNVTAKEWIVFAASPPELPGQSKASLVVDPGGRPAKEHSGLDRVVLLSRLPVRENKHQQELQIKVVYEATLHSRQLIALKPNEKPPDVPALRAEERKQCLGALGQLDHTSKAFQQWLDAAKFRRGKEEKDFDFARRVFLQIKKDFKYEFKDGMDRTASVVAGAGKSDCGGLSILFAATLRANGVPARVLAGRWAKSAKGGEKLDGVEIFQEHIKAEFFAEAIGWVPIDLAQAISFDRSAEGLQYFGSDPGDLLVVHIDTDLVLDSIHFGKQSMPLLQGVAYWVTGKGSDKGLTVTKAWEVKVLK